MKYGLVAMAMPLFLDRSVCKYLREDGVLVDKKRIGSSDAAGLFV